MAGVPQVAVINPGGKAVKVSEKSALKPMYNQAKKNFFAKADEQILGPKGSRVTTRGGAAKGGNVARASLNRFRERQEEQAGQSDEFMDMLRAMLEGGGSGGGGGRGAVRSFSDAQVADTQARLQALYNRYADDIAAQEAGIGQIYDTAGTSLGGIYDTSVGNIDKAYEAARAAQNQQLLALGMTEQTPVQTFGNQTAATTSLQNLRAAVLAQNEASRKAAITNQRLAAEGARREGTQNIARTIAEMQSAMTPVSGGGGGGGGGGGLSPNQFASLALQKMRLDQEGQIAAQRALSSQSQQRVDGGALVNRIMESNPGLSIDQAIQIARIS